jgi:hypothetical protein
LVVPRVTLPKDLAQILKRLEDDDLETLQGDVVAEIERRRLAKPATAVAEFPTPQSVSPVKSPEVQSKSSGTPKGVPAGKANLIRASYQTGMKPAAIARALRISPSLVTRVLGAPEKPKG